MRQYRVISAKRERERGRVRCPSFSFIARAQRRCRQRPLNRCSAAPRARERKIEGDRVRSILSLIVASDDRIAVSSPTGCSFDFQEERVPDTACVGADAPTPRTYVSQSHFHKFPLWGRINYFNGGRARVREDGSRILISGSGTCSAGAVGADG